MRWQTFVGPLCLLSFLAITRNSPKRYVLSLIVSVLHLYGVAIYYSSELIGPSNNCRPEPSYFWVYFVGFNLPWIAMPLGMYCCVRDVGEEETLTDRPI